MNLVDELLDFVIRDDVLTALRYARRLSSELSVSIVDDWLMHELMGYPISTQVPEYRMLMAHVAYQTVEFDGITTERLATVPVRAMAFRDSMTALLQWIGEAKLHNNDLGSEIVHEGMLATLRQQLAATRKYSSPRSATFMYRFNRLSALAIPDMVKNRILDWALELKRRGILGEGRSFNDEEKKKARAVQFNLFNCTVGQLSNDGINYGVNTNG